MNCKVEMFITLDFFFQTQLSAQMVRGKTKCFELLIITGRIHADEYPTLSEDGLEQVISGSTITMSDCCSIDRIIMIFLISPLHVSPRACFCFGVVSFCCARRRSSSESSKTASSSDTCTHCRAFDNTGGRTKHTFVQQGSS